MLGRHPEPVSLRVSPRYWLLAATGLLLLGAAGVAAVYLTMFNPRPVAVVSLPTPTPVASPPGGSPPALGGSWKVTGGFVGYRVREQLAQLPAPSDAVGRTSAVTGSAAVTTNPDGTATVDAISVTADMSQLQSDSGRRDNYIRGRYLETDRFPTAKFESTDPVTVPADVVSGATGKVSVKGRFTIHGVSMDVPLTLSVQRSGGSVNIIASYQFVWGQYGVERPSTPFASVQSNPTVEISLTLSPA